MSEQVYLIGDLRDRVVQELARMARLECIQGLAWRLGLPEWAVAKGVEAAFILGLIQQVDWFNGLLYWELAPPASMGLCADERSAVANISTFLED